MRGKPTQKAGNPGVSEDPASLSNSLILNLSTSGFFYSGEMTNLDGILNSRVVECLCSFEQLLCVLGRLEFLAVRLLCSCAASVPLFFAGFGMKASCARKMSKWSQNLNS